MKTEAAEKDLYLGCNLNHYFTPPAKKARGPGRAGRRAPLLLTRWLLGEHAYHYDQSPRRGLLLPCRGVSAPSLQRDALLLWRCHPHPGFLRSSKLPEGGWRCHAVVERHPPWPSRMAPWDTFLASAATPSAWAAGGVSRWVVPGRAPGVLHRELHREDHVLSRRYRGRSATQQKSYWAQHAQAARHGYLGLQPEKAFRAASAFLEDAPHM